MTRLSKFAISALLVTAACVGEDTEDTLDDHTAFIAEDDPSAPGVLRLVNAESFTVLDDVVALDRRAAENIIAHRDGADGIAGTGDDDPFDTIAELDAILFVGPATLDKLVAFAEANGWTVRHRALGDGSVIDQDTGLVWHQATLGPARWTVANGPGSVVGLCEASTIGNRTWRVPTRLELMTLVDKSFFPNHDPIYDRLVPMRSYWTSEYVPESSFSHAYTVDFAGGFIGAEWPSTQRAVRCVSN